MCSSLISKLLIFSLLVLSFFASCTFDYGDTEEYESPLPEITMEDLRYVRVKDAKTIASIEADIGDRYEKRHVMELKNFSFQQYDVDNGKVDSVGKGGKAVLELDTGNVQMSQEIHIKSESENITIDTEEFDWKDKTKTLTGPENSPVSIEDADGTTMKGNGFSADLRTKTWVFSAEVDGVFVLKDEEEETDGTTATEGQTQNTETEGKQATEETANEEMPIAEQS
ncbi:MAG: hypothetical protein Ta2G_10330 [Termitinemataceae bacterium]|nr:MAG: hypothetical protein Ta2G_10330 [Termitinemataceae bacterium]